MALSGRAWEGWEVWAAPVVLKALDDTSVIAHDSVHGVALKAAHMLHHMT